MQRHCDYERCPTMPVHCALHHNTLSSLPTPATLRAQRVNQVDDDYGTTHLLPKPPDVIRDDAQMYDDSDRISRMASCQTAKDDTRSDDSKATLPRDMTSPADKIPRNLSIDTLLSSAASPPPPAKERLATIHRTPQTNRVHVTLGARVVGAPGGGAPAVHDQVALNNRRNERQEGNTLTAMHSWSCLNTKSGQDTFCQCRAVHSTGAAAVPANTRQW